MAFNGDIDQAVAKVIPSASDAGKIAGLELLAIRMADANLNTVLDQIKSDYTEVKKAAYTALKDVVSEKDFTLLCGMLETGRLPLWLRFKMRSLPLSLNNRRQLGII